MSAASTTRYTGRACDILLLKTVLEPSPDTVVYPDVSVTPMAVTGIEKLVQRYAILFLNGLGTVRNSNFEGTEFMSSLNKGRIYDENTLKAEAVKANSLAESAILQGDAGLETPDDEALSQARIVEVGLDRSTRTVRVGVRLTTRAGQSYTYVQPITIGVC